MASRRQIVANRTTQRRVPARKQVLGKQYQAATPIGMVLSRWDEGADSGLAGFDVVLAEDFKGADMEVALQDLAQARSRQDRLRALKLGLILAVIEDAEPKQMRYLSSLEWYEKAALSRQRRALKRVKRNNG